MNYSQSDFFNILKEASPSYEKTAQVIASVLEISINEAYKKMRGKSAINFNQLIQLCDKFKVPFSYQPNSAGNVMFSLPNIDQKAPDMLSYMNDLLANLREVDKLSKKHIYITTDDIPLFHFFKYPELACFKLFFWADSTGMLNEKFDATYIQSGLIAVAREINELYLRIPSTEIWSKDTINGTIEQIRYAVEAGTLQDNELALKILIQLRSCLSDINLYAINGKKAMDAEDNFKWYCCDVLGSISYLVESPGTLTCYNRFNTFSYLKTDNPEYCEQTKHWMNCLIRKSVSFSGHGEKHRNRYINNSYLQIDQMIKEVEINTWG